MIRRIVQMFAALGSNTALTVISQLLLPAVFLRSYGVRMYGEWIVLSGAVSYLSTLNFGITTYASNEITMLYKRGETAQAQVLQGTSLALLLCMIGIGMIASAAMLLLPINKVLHLSAIGPSETQWTAFFLGLQALGSIVAGYYNSLFMVVEKTHRGLCWAGARVFGAVFVGVVLASLHARFHLLVLSQLLMIGVITLLSIRDLRIVLDGRLTLGVQGCNWKTAKRTLRLSGMFAMVFMQQFLTYQAPLNVIQWILGPSAVVMFSICRTVLSSARQVLALITNAISPEITFSFATRDMKRLLLIFHASERIVFTLIPIANVGAYLLAPIIVPLWVHDRGLFEPRVYAWMTLVSAAISVREHKQFFQLSTNTHRRLAWIVLSANVAMVALSVPFTWRFGLMGLLGVWLAAEIAQTILIFRENRALFDKEGSVRFVPVLQLSAILLLSLPICRMSLESMRGHSLTLQLLVVGSCWIGIVAVSCKVFGVTEVLCQLRRRLRPQECIEWADPASIVYNRPGMCSIKGRKE